MGGYEKRYNEREERIALLLHREGNYKRKFEQFFERMSDLTKNHVEAELCFDLMLREHVVDVFNDNDDKYNEIFNKIR